MARRSSWGYWDFADHDYEPRPTQADLRRRLGRAPAPVRGQGQKLALTFWGTWCNNLQRYHVFGHSLYEVRVDD